MTHDRETTEVLASLNMHTFCSCAGSCCWLTENRLVMTSESVKRKRKQDSSQFPFGLMDIVVTQLLQMDQKTRPCDERSSADGESCSLAQHWTASDYCCSCTCKRFFFFFLFSSIVGFLLLNINLHQWTSLGYFVEGNAQSALIFDTWKTDFSSVLSVLCQAHRLHNSPSVPLLSSHGPRYWKGNLFEYSLHCGSDAGEAASAEASHAEQTHKVSALHLRRLCRFQNWLCRMHSKWWLYTIECESEMIHILLPGPIEEISIFPEVHALPVCICAL